MGEFAPDLNAVDKAKIARVAVARRLLTLVYHALRSETGSRSYPVSSNPKVEARSMAVMASPETAATFD